MRHQTGIFKSSKTNMSHLPHFFQCLLPNAHPSPFCIRGTAKTCRPSFSQHPSILHKWIAHQPLLSGQNALEITYSTDSLHKCTPTTPQIYLPWQRQLVEWSRSFIWWDRPMMGLGLGSCEVILFDTQHSILKWWRWFHREDLWWVASSIQSGPTKWTIDLSLVETVRAERSHVSLFL